MKNVAILGSTGSVGRNTLEVIQDLRDYNVYAIIGGNNIPLLLRQAEKFNPRHIGSVFRENEEKLKKKSEERWDIITGIEACNKLAEDGEVDILVIATSGSTVYEPMIKALKNRKRVATANKETLISYYPLMRKLLRETDGELIPLDSEHSAIFQCLRGENRRDINKIILPASGGPFYMRESLEDITPAEALKHPNWDMGDKITIDSATLMNKGFEVIEASVLFDLEPEQIEVVIHPQSIIHGMVVFKDGSVVAQLSIPDMKIPISLGLTYPERVDNAGNVIDFHRIKNLNLLDVDRKKFPVIPLAYEVLKTGGTLPAVMVKADEVAVNAFLKEEISFLQIPEIIRTVVESHDTVKDPAVPDIKVAEKWAEDKAKGLMEK